MTKNTHGTSPPLQQFSSNNKNRLDLPKLWSESIPRTSHIKVLLSWRMDEQGCPSHDNLMKITFVQNKQLNAFVHTIAFSASAMTNPISCAPLRNSSSAINSLLNSSIDLQNEFFFVFEKTTKIKSEQCDEQFLTQPMHRFSFLLFQCLDWSSSLSYAMVSEHLVPVHALPPSCSSSTTRNYSNSCREGRSFFDCRQFPWLWHWCCSAKQSYQCLACVNSRRWYRLFLKKH